MCHRISPVEAIELGFSTSYLPTPITNSIKLVIHINRSWDDKNCEIYARTVLWQSLQVGAIGSNKGRSYEMDIPKQEEVSENDLLRH